MSHVTHMYECVMSHALLHYFVSLWFCSTVNPSPHSPHPAPPPQDEGTEGIFHVTVSWASEADCQSWRGSSRHHLPTGISQLAPAKGEGFPEQYTPFVQRQ